MSSILRKIFRTWVFLLLLIGMQGIALAQSQASTEVATQERTQEQAQEQTKKPAAPDAVVENFHVALIAAMKLDSFDAREQLLSVAVDDAFDVKRIASISVGRTWRSLTEDQQNSFVAALRELVIATYADRFTGFSGQRFETNTVQDVRSGTVVKTHLVRSDGSKVSLDYALRNSKVFNIVADGVSDLSLRRADYNSIIKRDGFAELLAHVRGKLQTLREGSAVEDGEDF